MSATVELVGTKIIHVHKERGRSGAYFATSSEINGLVLSANSPEELEKLIPGAITELYAACGVDVIVTPVDDVADDDTNKWAALSASVAKKKLAEIEAA